jgi:hypothetical protein
LQTLSAQRTPSRFGTSVSSVTTSQHELPLPVAHSFWWATRWKNTGFHRRVPCALHRSLAFCADLIPGLSFPTWRGRAALERLLP